MTLPDAVGSPSLHAWFLRLKPADAHWLPWLGCWESIAPTGPAVTEFHIAKPDGWPLGKYKVEILLNGQTAQTKDFTVKKD